ncbi:hypothetical protein B0T26DRAFT_788431 [Lasiosphaeria miniovina]|uniref:Uncharacterized protein n=1 Tax=Lasiosphaeria miniovina TaxID=1954250 RepID=A0AA39ZYM7_9PEZI|nr:uncharacterized protein B0T26DRAFT_788431 [Lasiosphaeria miniovina]KAK0706076.1 hypothetical protein B0T26DRAFT_788431 [Lasiosphaeria miniovina]
MAHIREQLCAERFDQVPAKPRRSSGDLGAEPLGYNCFLLSSDDFDADFRSFYGTLLGVGDLRDDSPAEPTSYLEESIDPYAYLWSTPEAFWKPGCLDTQSTNEEIDLGLYSLGCFGILGMETRSFPPPAQAPGLDAPKSSQAELLVSVGVDKPRRPNTADIEFTTLHSPKNKRLSVSPRGRCGRANRRGVGVKPLPPKAHRKRRRRRSVLAHIERIGVY